MTHPSPTSGMGGDSEARGPQVLRSAQPSAKLQGKLGTLPRSGSDRQTGAEGLTISK